MSNEKGTAANNSAVNSSVSLSVQENECPALVKKIGKALTGCEFISTPPDEKT